MENIILAVDVVVLREARRYAGEHNFTLEALLAGYLSMLADRAGRRPTVREQTYVDYRPPGEVIEAHRAEWLRDKGKAV